MLKVGLTGSIAVGKSFVVSVLAELGCVTFDADKIAHSVMEPGRPAHQDIAREFGPQVLAEDGSIDRARLGAIVFADEARRSQAKLLVEREPIRHGAGPDVLEAHISRRGRERTQIETMVS